MLTMLAELQGVCVGGGEGVCVCCWVGWGRGKAGGVRDRCSGVGLKGGAWSEGQFCSFFQVI